MTPSTTRSSKPTNWSRSSCSFIKGLFNDLTTLGVGAHGAIRQAEQPEEFRETELGPLPRSWGTDSIGRLANNLALGTAARGATDGKNKLRLLKMGNLGWDTLDTSNCELIDVERVVRWRDALLLDGDLMFNTRNTHRPRRKDCCFSIRTT